ncbi:Copia-like polyprotein/retrotransposon, partial [Rhizoctonia solani AG-3 Rhs1AP]
MDATTSETYASRKTYEIPLLKDDGSNYNAWKFRQTIVLKLRGLFGIVNGTDSLPAELSSADAKVATKVSDQAEAVKKWQKREDDAFAQVTLNMEDGAMTDVMEATSAKDAWTRVVERWEGKGMQSISFLYQQLINTKIGEEEDLTAAINNLRSLASKMKTLGEPLSDAILAQIMMRALPDSYAILNTVITSTPGAVVTSDIVIQAALAEEERRKKGAGLTAMFSHIPNKSKSSNAKSSNGKGKRKKDKGPPCLNCGKSGHTKEECWGKGGGAEGNGPHQKRRAAKEAKEKTTASTSKSENAKVAVSDDIPRPQETIYSFPVLDEYAKMNLSNSWILDSGASRHMTPNRHWFMTYQPLLTPIYIRVGNGNQIVASGVGRISIMVQNRQGIESEAVVEDVLHVPDLNSNLLSVRELNKRGVDVLFNKSSGAILVGGEGRDKELGYAKEVNGLFKLNARIQRTESTTHVAFVDSRSQNDSNDQEAREFVAYNAHTIARADLTTWHRRLGHINYDYVLEMVRKGAVEGMDIVGSRSPPSRCEPCIKGKQTRAPFPDSQNRASELLELMFSDLHGPTAIQAIGGFRYFSVTIDDKSRKMFVHILKSKDEYAGIFKELKALVENQTGKRVKALRTDGGGEYASTAFEKWMREQGIEHQKTEANSSASNGVAERAIRTLNDFQRTMRIDADMSDKYWGYAVKHAAHLWNITPKRFLNGRTPDEVFTGKKPDVARLRTFGCKAWARIPDDRRTKLQARSVECRYLGYAPNRKAHLLVERVSQRILTSRDVVFDEDGERRQRVIIEDYDVERVPKEVGDAETKPKVEPSEPDDSDVKSEGESAKSEPESEARTRSPSPMPAEPPPVETPPEPRRSTRETRPPVRYGANVGVDDLSLLLSNPHIVEFAFAADLKSPPLTFAEAMARPDANLWLGAMVEELESIQKHGVYKETDRPGDRNVVGCRWIFSFKFGPDGEVVRYKARLVAKGFSQREGVDFGETSSPVAASDSWRVILGIATSEDLEMLQLDIKTAFLHGEVEEEIYMEQPEGFGKGDGRVWKLAKALYGLKQAARAFYMKLRGVLEKIGFTKCETDHAVFWCREDDKLAIILAHVDDMLLVGKPLSFLEGFKSEMAKFFDIVDLGEPRMFFLYHIMSIQPGTYMIHPASDEGQGAGVGPVPLMFPPPPVPLRILPGQMMEPFTLKPKEGNTYQLTVQRDSWSVVPKDEYVLLHSRDLPGPSHSWSVQPSGSGNYRGWLSVRILEPCKRFGSSKMPVGPPGCKTHRGTRYEMRSETDLEAQRVFLNCLESEFRKRL